MYNTDMLGSSHQRNNKYERAYLRKQRILATRHRKMMKLRELREVSTPQGTYFREKISFIEYIRYCTRRLRNIINHSTRTFKNFFTNSTKPMNQSNSPVSEIRQTTKRRRRILKPKKSIPPKKTKKTFWGYIKIILIILGIGGVFLLGLFFFWFSTLEIPSVQNFENRKISNSTKIYDRTGEILLYDIHENIRRTVVDFDEIAPSAKDAIVAIEDHTFYEHNGVVWTSTIRGALQTVINYVTGSKETVGGSTLTQQVVKNTLLNRDKRITRKVKEWVLAYKIEDKLSKDEILEIYLNEAPYGGMIYGIQEASLRFFGIPASELTIAQSAYLAAIPNLPTYYSPYGPNKDELDQRQQTVLREMKQYGFITDAQYRQAQSQEVVFLPEENSEAKSLHFVQYVRSILEETYGVDMVQNGGLHVVTSLDYELQLKAEEIIKEHIEEVGEEFNASNAGLIAIDNRTGQIITMVGSRDYFDTEDFDGNYNVTLALRQPGSAFKPIAYVTAFEKGYLPESSIFDTETQFNAKCEPTDTSSDNGCYSPNNYDFEFRGPLSFRSALAESRNVPAVKVSYLAGISNVIQKARDMGITSLDQSPEYYGLGLVLGGGEVSLLEMTGAYSVFGNEGIYNKPTAILEVRDVDGNILEKYIPDEVRVVDENAARMINSILSDNVARAPLFGSNSFLYFGERDVAGKTGTTNDNRDAWLIGYTPQVSVGVWTGNNDNTPMKKGSSISGKPWRAYMDEVLKGYDPESFNNYELPSNFDTLPNMVRGNWYGGTTIYIDKVSGKLATEFTPEATKIAVPQPDPHTILHWIDKEDPQTLDISHDDPQYRNWEYGVQKFVQEYLSAILNIHIDLPTEYDDVHSEDDIRSSFEFDIEGIEQTSYTENDRMRVSFTSSDRDNDEISSMQVFVNNAFVQTDNSEPFEVVISLDELPYLETENIMRVILTDTNGVQSIEEQIFDMEL